MKREEKNALVSDDTGLELSLTVHVLKQYINCSAPRVACCCVWHPSDVLSVHHFVSLLNSPSRFFIPRQGSYRITSCLPMKRWRTAPPPPLLRTVPYRRGRRPGPALDPPSLRTDCTPPGPPRRPRPRPTPTPPGPARRSRPSWGWRRPRRACRTWPRPWSWGTARGP